MKEADPHHLDELVDLGRQGCRLFQRPGGDFGFDGENVLARVNHPNVPEFQSEISRLIKCKGAKAHESGGARIGSKT
jgi:hypothetical protein